MAASDNLHTVRCGVFVNYRRDDTGWAAKLLADALRRRLGSSANLFIDNRSIDQYRNDPRA